MWVRLVIGRIISLPTLNMLDNLTIYNLHIYYFDNVSLLKARVAISSIINNTRTALSLVCIIYSDTTLCEISSYKYIHWYRHNCIKTNYFINLTKLNLWKNERAL